MSGQNTTNVNDYYFVRDKKKKKKEPWPEKKQYNVYVEEEPAKEEPKKPEYEFTSLRAIEPEGGFKNGKSF